MSLALPPESRAGRGRGGRRGAAAEGGRQGTSIYCTRPHLTTLWSHRQTWHFKRESPVIGRWGRGKCEVGSTHD
ncbi:hypothetical protein J6590_036914 [Homalodisca vitripennis]|nr:hypothetical protein J6590_036914 [Homalodisca vitripennis]